jgi:hypothetical protein
VSTLTESLVVHGMGGVASELESLATLLAELVAQPPRARVMGARARAYAENHYAMANVERMVECIETLAGDPRRPRLNFEP